MGSVAVTVGERGRLAAPGAALTRGCPSQSILDGGLAQLISIKYNMSNYKILIHSNQLYVLTY